MAGSDDLIAVIAPSIFRINAFMIRRVPMCSGLVHDPQAFVRISLKSGIVNSKTEAMFPMLYESKELTLA